MFRFRFILDYFQLPFATGPTLEANMRAKWLSQLCPKDLEIGFSPFAGQKPMYHSDKFRIVPKDESGWWNHYYFNSWQMEQETRNWSLGPNINPQKKATQHVPIVVYSQYQKNQLLKSWTDYPDDLINIIPNMVDHGLFKPGKKNKRFTVGWIGYDYPSRSTKGVEVIPYLARRFPDIQFQMIHAKPPAYRHLWLPVPLKNLTIYEQVPHHQMRDMISQWHLLICGSKWETGATHVKEAMACGVPVIGCDVGALPEVAGSQILLKHMKWEPVEPEWVVWTQESLERFAAALEEVLLDSRRYKKLVKDAIAESRKSNPKIIASHWFDFMYKCRDFQQ
ncbi:glycosyltransferase [Paenibacillus sp. JMULE4]|nr:glycosyltransferase family 4 protein [Paenibacillus sp. JMULE4]NTZ16602.1 glycosyltransferase [Paenibacillus sp. JMULE4]